PPRPHIGKDRLPPSEMWRSARRNCHKSAWAGTRAGLGAEMLGEFQPLMLITGGGAGAVERVRRAGELLVHEPADRLPVLEQERHVAAAHLENRARRRAPVQALPEARIEEAGVVNAKFAEGRVDRRHFRREIGGNLHFLPGSQNVELVRIEDQAPVVARVNRLPEVLDSVAAQAVHIDDVAVPDRPIADDRLAEAPEIDPEHHALAQVERAVGELAGEAPLAQAGVVERERAPVPLLGVAASESDLVQFRPRPDADAEAAGRNLEPELAL